MSVHSSVGITGTSPRAPRTAAGCAAQSVVPRRVAEVLEAVVGRLDGPGLVVRKLADGRQARLLSVPLAEDALPFTGGDAVGELIIKLYRDHGPAAQGAALDEFECLRRLYDRLDGRTHHGWKVRCPRPLHYNRRCNALVMTRVPGRTLSWHLAHGKGPAPALLDSICRGLDSCLLHYWAGEPRLYGDLILNNVLCDLPSRTLSLVDPGMPEPFYDCAAAPRSWYPASRDLGFLLFWTASLVRPSLAHPVLHARQKRLALRIVRTFVEGLSCEAERQEATAEIEACARLHVARMRVSGSPGGLWRGAVKRIATRTIDSFVHELRAPQAHLKRGGYGC